jgi:hypothetical protein
MPSKGTPRKIESSFLRLKLAFIALIVFTILGFIGDYLELKNSWVLYDFAKITLGFLIGSGISTGFSR